jgi:hypothetical protein
MQDEALEMIKVARKSFGEMLIQAEGMKAQALSQARASLAYQFAEKMACEAEKALNELDRQEAELLAE